MTELKNARKAFDPLVSKQSTGADLNVTDSRSSVRPFAKRAAAYVTVARCTAPKATASLKYARLQTRTGGVGLTVEKPAILPRAHLPCAEKSGRRSRQRLAVLAHFAFKAEARVF